MKKLIKLEFDNTTKERKTENSYSELYSYDKNNGSFEFNILNDTLTTEQVTALFKFTQSEKIWKTTGTVEGNKVKVIFDTSLITQNETVVCYLYLDEEQRTSDTYRFKFKVKVSEIDRIHTYDVKERLFNKGVIVDKSDVVTKIELEEMLKSIKGISTDGLLTEVKAEETYAKKSEAVDNTNFELIKNRVLALELKTDKDTVYDDSELKGRISVLEAREDKDTKYDDTNVRERLTALENKPNVDVSNLATKDELNEIKNSQPTVDTSNLVTRDELTAKNFLTTHQDLSEYAKKSEIPAPYNDTELVQKIGQLEARVDKDTVYDDTPLKERVTALESKAIEGGAYDDTDLKNRVTTLENKPNVDLTNYVTNEQLENKHYLTQHQPLDNLVTKQELENKHFLTEHQPLTHLATTGDLEALRNISISKADLSKKVDKADFNTFKDSVVTKDELAGKNYLTEHQNLDGYVKKSELGTSQPNQTLSLNNSTLSISGGNSVELPVNKYEIHGTGMPNGVVEAEIGTTYVDKNKTNGALKWIKTTDGGNTGWEVLIGDTGWRTLNSISKLTDGSKTSYIKVRRVNNLVTYQFGGLNWGWFGIIRRNGPGFVKHNSSGDKGAKVVYPGGIPVGFRSETSLVGSTYDDKGRPYGMWYLGGKSDSNFIQLTFNEDIPTDRDIGDIRVSAISYLTEEPWPTTLP